MKFQNFCKGLEQNSPKVKWYIISCTENNFYELPRELPNDVRFRNLRILVN